MTNTQTVHIRVRGRLSRRLATAFAGMTLVPRNGTTDLVGEVVDQAQLHGLLTRIRDLALELESLTIAPADPTTKKED
jgi:hypothetical protein